VRNVRRRIAIAEKGFQLWPAAFRKDLAVALVVEAIDHHPVIAGAILKQLGGLVAQRTQRGCRADLVQRAGDVCGKIDRWTGAFQLDDQAALRRSMQQSIKRGGRASDPAAHRNRRALRHGIEMRQ
jgi:hypothetical protein